MNKSYKSYLFVPANQDKFIDKAHLRSADIVVLDLEDSILQESKASARIGLLSAIDRLKDKKQKVAVRINNDLGNLAEDLKSIDYKKVDTILYPKAESGDVISFISEYVTELESDQCADLHSTSIVPMIETCKGVMNMQEVANASSRVSAIALGSEDLSCELGVPPSTESLISVCQKMALVAGEAGISALGFPGSIAEFSDIDKLKYLLTLSKNIGFNGALCIHPAQVLEVNKVFTYSDEQKDWAKRVVESMDAAIKDGKGACKLDGKMIDPPVVALARKIMDQV